MVNIAELLKDSPEGMELYCTMFDNVTLDRVDDFEDYPIKIVTKNGFSTRLTKYGQNIKLEDAKCVIFPKGKTTWDGFQSPFKDGDIVTNQNNIGTWIGIYHKYDCLNETFSSYCYIRRNGEFCANSDKGHGCYKTRLATEEEKKKLFKAIKDYGYRWNAETKTLEKLFEPKFKVGDKIRNFVVDLGNIYTVLKVETTGYTVKKYNELVNCHISFNEEKNYVLVANKFDTTTLKPFDRVLVRLDNTNQWYATLFSHIDERLECFCRRYVTVSGKSYTQMIPYKGNEHLCGTKDDCDDFYKNW